MIPRRIMKVKPYSSGVDFFRMVKVDFAGSTSSNGSGPPLRPSKAASNAGLMCQSGPALECGIYKQDILQKKNSY